MQETFFGYSGKSQSSGEDDEIDVVVPTSRLRSQQSSRRVAPTPLDDVPPLTAAAAAASAVTYPGGSETEIRIVEKLLKNGDMYKGGLSVGVPHGAGKYLWSDGCMYEGEWVRGKACGKGRFSWPTGATYEGEFKDGRMDGEGTFIGIDGDTYRGHWLWGRKHGYGEKRYANGDVYQGNWKANLQDGHGRYLWSEGNEYVGEWRNGVISGMGLMTWTNGNRYEGFWENGAPKGKGVFSWAADEKNSHNNHNHNHNNHNHNNHFGVGGWGRKKKKESMSESMEEDMTRKLLSMDAAPRSTNFPRICIWELDGDAGDITCDIVDNIEAASTYSPYTSESDTGDNTSGCGETESMRSPLWSERGGTMNLLRSPKLLDVKKPGQTVTIGHKNYDLMLNLQLGIRYSVGKHASVLRELKPSDFEPREKFWTRFPPEGSTYTPPHQSVEFKWKDYCPMVFRHLRELFAIDQADYMLAICGNESLREFSSPGKSGSSFYLTQDERFMIKTVKKSEIKVLIKMLPSYYEHVCKYKNSLVTKFFGMHCVKPVGSQKVRFIVMGNLFCSEYRIHKRFDLKGSSHGRKIDKPAGEIDENTTLKDLDLKYVFRLESSWYHEFIGQIDRDCEFLEAEKIMDYSLLIGLHFRDDCLRDDMSLSFPRKDPDDRLMRGYHSLPNMDWIIDGRSGGPLIRLGANTPAKAERMMGFESDPWNGGGGGSTSSTRTSMNNEVADVILYFGIIDILQDYDISKRLEHAYKSLQVDPTSISAVDPKLYSRRFRDFIHRVFLEDK